MVVWFSQLKQHKKNGQRATDFLSLLALQRALQEISLTAGKGAAKQTFTLMSSILGKMNPRSVLPAVVRITKRRFFELSGRFLRWLAQTMGWIKKRRDVVVMMNDEDVFCVCRSPRRHERMFHP